MFPELVAQCYWYMHSGNITSSSTSGGIAGSSEGDDSITACVAINATINAFDDAGRIAGYIYYPGSSEISNNFALTVIVAGGVAGFNAGDIQSHGINKSDAALKTQSTYSSELGWKFGTSDASPWRITAGVYPFLYWE